MLHDGVGTYGLIVGAYSAGNVLSNLLVGSLAIRRHAAMYFAGKVVLGGGFLLLAGAQTQEIAMLGAARAAVGGPMGDIPLLVVMQTELPTWTAS